MSSNPADPYPDTVPSGPIRSLLHELNNQLGVVMGSLSLMDTLMESDLARAKRIMSLAQEGAQKMTRLIIDYKNGIQEKD